mmetsp:Transcript_7125/g.17728  ORF Transcript_7125/g.17728 Transcript_7125/m.17728 type:complete len:321 (+) Transcript_7125:32-994(+)
MSSANADQKKENAEAQAQASAAVPSAGAMVEYDTDIVYNALFTKQGVTETRWSGFPSFSMRFFRQLRDFVHIVTATEKRQVVVLDARQRSLDYATCGFAMRPLKSHVADWQQVTVGGSEQQALFQAELERVILELHPDVQKITIAGYLLRGGPNANPPATDGLHLDFYPDMERVKAVHGKPDEQKLYPEFDGLEMKMVLGLWMPREMANPVYDHPLFFGDASTFAPEDVVPQEQDFDHVEEGGMKRVRNLAASQPIFSERQRWYYYSQQTCEEVVVFRHLTQPAGGKACFHAALRQPLPDGMETRKSIEARAFLYFSKSN